ncbi:hypothetical protein K2173_017564 [Erythroxylum novogranatense]|uniref:NAC domain-containing protein n=1 Tax=Erythroxylum novogranatense TaxID=1862640 RepID=A0AAV8T9H1_9ROSI|nr:hypothetical protein K2173_017564 [Erythroxylum novogranatense]
MKNPQSTLPPGFRFHPTDEELIVHYLKKKVTSTPFPLSIIADVDIYKLDPWDLPARATFGEKEWYFFSPRDRKYPNGARPNRAAASGYWKATGTDKVIMASTMATIGAGGTENIGVKKALVFYKGRPPKGVKTNWIMHEYRLADASSYANNNSKPMRPKDLSMRLDDWVLCRIYKKSHSMTPSAVAAAASSDHDQEEEEEQFVQETLLPTLNSPISNNSCALMPQKSSSFSNLLDPMDFAILSSLFSENQLNTSGYESTPTMNAATTTLDQPFHNNSNTGFNGSNSYLFQKLPQLNTPFPNMENKPKRQASNFVEDELHPSKKPMNFCSFSTTTQTDTSQYRFLNQPLLSQQLLLGPQVQFQR